VNYSLIHFPIVTNRKVNDIFIQYRKKKTQQKKAEPQAKDSAKVLFLLKSFSGIFYESLLAATADSTLLSFHRILPP
jgi:hypothetical protein